MFSLIITIVSIALVVALVAATMYHGGDTLTQGRNTADAAAFVTGAQQVSGAQVMHTSLEGEAAADVATLITAQYLAAAPSVKGSPLVLDLANQAVTSTVTSADVCQAINKSSGLKSADTADADDTDDDLVVVAADLDDFTYGCVTTGAAFSFKY